MEVLGSNEYSTCHFQPFFPIYSQSLLLGEKYFEWIIIMKTVSLELWLCLSGVRDRGKTSRRKSTAKPHYKSSLVLCFYSGFVQIETSNAPSWWCKESTHALVHLSPHSSLRYCSPRGKEIIPCSHVFNKSSKRKTKNYLSNMFKNFPKTWAHFCVEVKGVSVFHGRSCVWLCRASCHAHGCCCLSLQVSMFSIPIVDLILEAQSCQCAEALSLMGEFLGDGEMLHLFF